MMQAEILTKKQKKKLAKSLWDQHQQCFDGGDLDGALAKLKEAEQLYPGNSTVTAQIEKVEAAVQARSGENKRRAAELWKEHERCEEVLDHDGALAKLREALALFPGNPAVENQIAAIEAAKAREAAEAAEAAKQKQATDTEDPFGASSGDSDSDDPFGAPATPTSRAQAAIAQAQTDSLADGLAGTHVTPRGPRHSGSSGTPSANALTSSGAAHSQAAPGTPGSVTSTPGRPGGGGGGGDGGGGGGGSTHDGGPLKVVDWVPNASADQCMCCNATKFTRTKRRHHCRHCGHVIGKCCSQLAMLPAEFSQHDPQRVCSTCFGLLAPLQEDLIERMSNANRSNVLHSKGGKARKGSMNSPVDRTLGHAIRKAAYTVENFFFSSNPNSVVKDHTLVKKLLANAHGLAFLTVIRAGFIGTGRFGTGLVIAKLPDGTWSAPSAIATMGGGIGGVGGMVTDVLLVLNSEKAVKAFSGGGGLQLGVGLALAVGPVGRSGEAEAAIGKGTVAPVYAYSQAKGFFAGAMARLGIVIRRGKVNRKFYGRKVSSKDLLTGKINPPPNAQPLYEALQTAASGGVTDL